MANANPAIIRDNGGNDKGGNRRRQVAGINFAAPIVVVGNPSVIVLIKNAVIAVVIILSAKLPSVGVAALIITLISEGTEDFMQHYNFGINHNRCKQARR